MEFTKNLGPGPLKKDTPQLQPASQHVCVCERSWALLGSPGLFLLPVGAHGRPWIPLGVHVGALLGAPGGSWASLPAPVGHELIWALGGGATQSDGCWNLHQTKDTFVWRFLSDPQDLQTRFLLTASFLWH